MPSAVWDAYKNRVESRGESMREAAKRRETHFLNSKLARSLSYFETKVNGKIQKVAIVNSDNLNEKTIYSMPGETIACGSMVEWADNFWLVTEKDAATEVYTKCIMMQCNHLLRWVDDAGIIREQWCVIEDGTKLKCTRRYTIVWRWGNAA